MFSFLKKLSFGDLVAEVPIVQGGMGVGVSMHKLASAVANQGGIGVISAAAPGYQEPDFSKNFLEANIRGLRKEIRKARELSNGIIGVNIMCAMSNFEDMVKTSIEECVDIIFCGAGLPLTLPSFLTPNSKTKLVPIISSPRAASLIAKRWVDKFNYVPDGFVLEGPKAGGHLGFKYDELFDEKISLETLVPSVVTEVKKISEKYGKKIPVIAGGGIYSGKDMKKIIELGADGIQMASRFVPTIECDASTEFKMAYVNAKEEDIKVIKSPVGLPGRAVSNKYLEDVESGMKMPKSCPFKCIVSCNPETSPYCIIMALINACKGNMSHGFAFAGSNAFLTDKIISVEELISSLEKEYLES